MKVLIVDDDSKSVQGIKDHCDDQAWECKVVDFEQTYREILLFDPDAIVLDWWDGFDKVEGDNVLDTIWGNGYRQIIVFSGNVEHINLTEKKKESTILCSFAKGDEQPIIDYLDENKQYIEVLSQYRKEMGKALVNAFNVIEPIKKSSPNYLGDEIIKYFLAKRTVNYFDIEETGEKLPAWGMYIFPPVLSCLSVCDIIRKIPENGMLDVVGTADEYKLILTPSCDLYRGEGRTPKVENVLCAKCFDCSKFGDSAANGSSRNSGAKKKIKNALTQGYSKNWVALPEMVNMCPGLSVDLKNLEIIPLSEIIEKIDDLNENHKYVRVGSVDSPFREQIVWAFMQNACRPGVPDRDFDEWTEKIT